MYGTIARIKVKPGMVDALRAWGDAQDPPDNGGILLIFQADSDPHELWLVMAVESREAYRANAESPAQHSRFLEMMEFLVAEPEWHDGEVLQADL
jgi:hypothetical protein